MLSFIIDAGAFRTHYREQNNIRIIRRVTRVKFYLVMLKEQDDVMDFIRSLIGYKDLSSTDYRKREPLFSSQMLQVFNITIPSISFPGIMFLLLKSTGDIHRPGRCKKRMIKSDHFRKLNSHGSETPENLCDLLFSKASPLKLR